MAVVIRRTQQFLDDESPAGLAGTHPMLDAPCYLTCAALFGSVIQEIGVPFGTALEKHYSTGGRSLNRLENKRVRELSPVDVMNAPESCDLTRDRNAMAYSEPVAGKPTVDLHYREPRTVLFPNECPQALSLDVLTAE